MLASYILVTPMPLWGQVPSDSSASGFPLEEALDALGPSAIDTEALAEVLADLAANPLYLNTATASELAALPFLSPLIAQRIVRLRSQQGPFSTIAELRAVEGLTEERLERMRPYLIVSADAAKEHARFAAPPSWTALRSALRFDFIQRATRRLDLARGYSDDTTRTTYLGSPLRLYTRLRLHARRHLSMNLTLDKDPGELFRWHPESHTYGFDHVSAHVALRDMGRLQTLIVGDFTAEYGQGVTLWRGRAFGKGRAAVDPVARSGRGLVPSSSSEENRFFRGVAGSFFLIPEITLSAFASRRTLDASSTAPDTVQAAGNATAQISTLSAGGLHRTSGELERKDALGEHLVGGSLAYTSRSLSAGVVGYHSRFDAPIAPPDRPYRYYSFRGQQATMLSTYASIFLGDLLFFGEVGRAPGGTYGGTGGLVAEVGRTVEAVVQARHFPKDFTSLHGRAFGEGGAAQNETGFYLGLRLRPGRRWTLSGYFDQYRFPWVRFAVPRPSSGYETRLILEHRPRPWLTYYLQIRSETREAGVALKGAGPHLLDGLQPETRQSSRLHVDYAFSEHLRLRSRLEGTRYVTGSKLPRKGLILYQDVRWRPTPWLQADARLAFFDTDGYNARVYAYENDLLYAFSVPAFFGRGQRAYLVLKLSPLRALDVQIKYAATHFQGVEHFGSGLNETAGRRLRELRFQFRWKL